MGSGTVGTGSTDVTLTVKSIDWITGGTIKQDCCAVTQQGGEEVDPFYGIPISVRRAIMHKEVQINDVCCCIRFKEPQGQVRFCERGT